MIDKPLIWLGSSLEDVRAFPADARRLAGYQLRRVQSGLMPSDWKPMKTIGPGVNEIRIHTGIEHRVFYLARFAEALSTCCTPSRSERARLPVPILIWRKDDSRSSKWTAQE